MPLVYRRDLSRVLTSDEVDENFKQLVKNDMPLMDILSANGLSDNPLYVLYSGVDFTLTEVDFPNYNKVSIDMDVSNLDLNDEIYFYSELMDKTSGLVTLSAKMLYGDDGEEGNSIHSINTTLNCLNDIADLSIRSGLSDALDFNVMTFHYGFDTEFKTAPLMMKTTILNMTKIDALLNPIV